MESWLRDWAEAWGHSVRIVNQTNTLGAINVAGPRARDLLAKLTSDPIDPKSIPYGGIRRLTVAGVPCVALRVGFVGELSFELHHPRLDSVKLWDALLAGGAELGIQPHGLEALRLLRLEKGHIIVGQDTDFDSTPAKLGLEWAVKMSKPDFVGRSGLSRLATIEPNRVLRAFTFPGTVAPLEGAQLLADGERVGYLTSSRFSPVLGHGIALGWVYRTDAGFPSTVRAVDGSGADLVGTVTTGPFFDPEGGRLRA
jgi:sarcosine oxidase subunit alpha